jgi:hypothetical protein
MQLQQHARNGPLRGPDYRFLAASVNVIRPLAADTEGPQAIPGNRRVSIAGSIDNSANISYVVAGSTVTRCKDLGMKVIAAIAIMLSSSCTLVAAQHQSHSKSVSMHSIGKSLVSTTTKSIKSIKGMMHLEPKRSK